MAQAIPETIFVQTDPAFIAVLLAAKELQDNKRLKVKYFQAVSISNIESDDDSDDRRLMFGGKAKSLANSAFARTASAVVRMCMLEAAGVDRDFWPTIGAKTAERNEKKLVKKNDKGNNRPPPLADTRSKAKEYWCQYDQLYPHFLIENEVLKVGIDNTASIPRIMMIFRSNFTELIEIITHFTATWKGDQLFQSFVSVSYTVKEIIPGEDGTKGVAQLKAFMSSPKYCSEYCKFVFNAHSETDQENLSSLLKKTKIKTEGDEQ